MTRDQWDRERLRQEAARLLRQSVGEVSDVPADVRDLVRELQLYQTELEEQNDELRRLQSELEESRDRYSDLYDFAPTGYLSVDSSDAIVAANLVAAELFQVPRERVIGSFLKEHVDRHFHEDLTDCLCQTRQSGENQTCDVRLNAGGISVYVRLLMDVISRSEDSGPALRIALSNVSEEKAAEFAAQRRAQQKRLANHHQSLGSIAGGFAEDVSRLLAPIVAQTAFIAQQLPEDSGLHEHLDKIVAHTDVAAELCGTMSRHADGLHRDHRFAIEEFVHTLPTWLSEELPAARLEYSCSAVGDVSGSRSQLECCLRALCQNAAEAVSDGEPQISIDVTEAHLSEDRLTELLAADAAQPGSYFAIHVHDNGIGVPPEAAGRLLDADYSTRAADRGSGLAMVRQIVTRHRGALAVASRPSGTTVTVFLPVAAASTAGPSIYRRSELVRGEGRILLVDADTTVRQSTQRVLQEAGYRVDAPVDANAACQLFEQAWADIDAVLLDAEHSELQTVQTLLELRRCQTDAVVLVRCGRRSLSLNDYRELGASGVLRKPCSAFELTRKLKTILLGTDNCGAKATVIRGRRPLRFPPDGRRQ
ncbi:MAG: ATP-binding protein [Planctomycetaceae bacterium]|nr:ATP-binding protein [Planctomycetaceae bacterium]